MFCIDPLRATVIFPTYGFAPFAQWALRSVCNQSVKKIEIFIICDGSPPEMIALFNELANEDKRIRVYEFPKSDRTGEIYRDLLIKKVAKGRNIFYCSHDDLWLPDHIKEIEKSLARSNFAHSIHAMVNEFAEEFIEENIFRSLNIIDLSDIKFRNRMLDDTVLENFFGLTFAAHPRKSYNGLPVGWTTTPTGIWTDLYMWRKFLRKYGNSCVTCKIITALSFPASLRREWSEQDRSDELEFFHTKIQDPDFIQRIRNLAKKSLNRKQA